MCQRDGTHPNTRDLYEAVVEGAVERVRPKMMTVTAIMAGLLPILWGTGTGASVMMKRIAAPMVGGMVSSTVFTLIVIPAVYSWWRERQLADALSPIGVRLSRKHEPVIT